MTDKNLCLREKLNKLLEVDELPQDEHEAITFALTIIGDHPGEGLLYDEVEALYTARYEFYYDRQGNRRRAA